MLSVIATLLILLALAVGALVATDVASVLATGVPDASLARELERDVFGYPGWPKVVNLIGWIVSASLMQVAALLLAARRRRGGAVQPVQAHRRRQGNSPGPAPPFWCPRHCDLSHRRAET